MKRSTLVAILFFILLPVSATAMIKCEVISVIKGDTFICLTDHNKKLTVKLYQVNAPELAQTFGNESKHRLAQLIFNHSVEITSHKKDEQGRILGTIYRVFPRCKYKYATAPECFRKEDINLLMINSGMAQYIPLPGKNTEYELAQRHAKKTKTGIWSQKYLKALEKLPDLLIIK